MRLKAVVYEELARGIRAAPAGEDAPAFLARQGIIASGGATVCEAPDASGDSLAAAPAVRARGAQSAWIPVNPAQTCRVWPATDPESQLEVRTPCERSFVSPSPR